MSRHRCPLIYCCCCCWPRQYRFCRIRAGSIRLVNIATFLNNVCTFGPQSGLLCFARAPSRESRPFIDDETGPDRAIKASRRWIPRLGALFNLNYLDFCGKLWGRAGRFRLGDWPWEVVLFSFVWGPIDKWVQHISWRYYMHQSSWRRAPNLHARPKRDLKVFVFFFFKV